MYIKKLQQAGFTIIEISLVLGLLGLVIYLTLSFSAATQDATNRHTYQQQQRTWSQILEKTQDLYLPEAVAGEILLPANDITITVTPAGVGVCGSDENQNALEGLIAGVGLNDDTLLNNPWGGGWCLVVGSVAFLPIDGAGAEIGLRPMAIFSAGQGAFETTITNLLLECPESSGDDSLVICNNGAAGAIEKVHITQERLDATGRQIALYSRARAASIPQGGFIDYFLNGPPNRQPTGCDEINQISAYSGDPDSPFPTTATESTDTRGLQLSEIAANSQFFRSVGISPNQIFDGFNEALWIDNSSCEVRHPYNADDNLSAPPFSMRVIATLPGGQNLTKIIFTDF